MVVGKLFSDVGTPRVSSVLPNSALLLSSSFFFCPFPDVTKTCCSTSVCQALRNQAYTNSPLQQLEHSAQENANLKHSVSPGAYHCSGPRTIGRFGANTSGDDCTPHKAGKYTKSSGSPGLSTANTFIPCGLAISSCGLTSISAI